MDKLIALDVRNNSAWNQRFFVLKYTGLTADGVLQREANYAMNRIRLVKNNESSWSFLRGLLQEGDGTLDQFDDVSGGRRRSADCFGGRSTCSFLYLLGRRRSSISARSCMRRAAHRRT